MVTGGVREYLVLYKNFSENLTTTMRLLMQDDVSVTVLKDVYADLNELTAQVPQ